MNAEFHYYALYALCLRAGFDDAEARTIAHSSQYVDNALVSYEVVDGGAPYRTLVTQNYLFWDEETLRDAYLPFHFLPGDVDRLGRERADGRASRYATSPDSPISKELLVGALQSRDPFRIGIALHAYADGWAHQHFSGRLEESNALDPSSPLPPAGHLQALRLPDEPLGRWRDPRLLPALSAIDNGERFLAAARKIFRYLRTSLKRPFDDEELVLGELLEAWRAPVAGRVSAGREARARIDEMVIRFDLAPYSARDWPRAAGLEPQGDEGDSSPGYDKLAWAKAEIAHRATGGSGRPVRRASSGGRFEGSELHRWDLAARAHRDAAWAALRSAGFGKELA